MQVNRAVEKQAITDFSLACATRYLQQLQAGEKPMNAVHPSSVSDADVAVAEPPLWLVSGGSIYARAWNILLGARNQGYDATLTSWGIAREPELQNLLKIPADWAVAAIMPLGKPLKQLTQLRRKPVAEILAQHRWHKLAPGDSAS